MSFFLVPSQRVKEGKGNTGFGLGRVGMYENSPYIRVSPQEAEKPKETLEKHTR